MPTGSAFQASLIIPIYNEVDCIREELDTLFAYDWLINYEIIIVDDGSSDGSSEVLKEYLREGKPFRLLRHERNKGYGAALKTGIAASCCEYIVITDCDNSYPNDRIPEFVELAANGDYDMVVGSRTGENVTQSRLRRIGKWPLIKLASFLAGQTIPDINSGLRVFKRSIARAAFGYLCDGFSFTTTITLIMLCNGFKVKYVPIDYFPRGGQSKIKPIRDTLNFIMLITTTVFYFKPTKVLIPVCVPLIVASLLIFTVQALVWQNITTASLILFISSLIFFVISIVAELVIRSGDLVHISRLASQRQEKTCVTEFRIDKNIS